MALQFTNGTIMHVDMGSPAAFDDLTTLSALLLVNVGAFGPGGTVLIAKKVDGGMSAGWGLSLPGTTGQVSFNRRYTSDATVYTSGDNMMSATGTWRWVACTFDQSAASGQKVKLYSGAYGGSLTEATSYSTATDAATASLSDASRTLRLGHYNSAAPPSTPTGAIEYAVLYNAAVSLANLQAAVDAIEDTGTNSFTTGRVGEWKVGWGGGTTVPDQSGGGNNGTVTTAANTTGFLEYSAARRFVVLQQMANAA